MNFIQFAFKFIHTFAYPDENYFRYALMSEKKNL